MPGALMAWTDEELVSRSVRGDHDSFNQLVVRWQRPIYALAYRVIGHEEDARDVCQETFLRAFRGIKGFKGEAKFSSWLYRIALNLCRDKNRSAQRSPLNKVSDDVDVLDLAPPEAAGSSLDQVLKTTIFLSSLDLFAEVNEAYASYFVDAPPASATVAVAGLPKNVEGEIEVLGYC